MTTNTEGEMMVARRPLWRRIVNRLVPPEAVAESWYELHDRVPAGGDMVTTRTEIRLDLLALVRLCLLGGRLSVETRTITAGPATVIETHGRTSVG